MVKACVLAVLMFASVCCVHAQYHTTAEIDSIKKSMVRSMNESEFIRSSFLIADAFMDIDHYDSAQIWLNKIHDRLPSKKASLFSYFLVTRQAEVYYYNNLQQLGMLESFKGLEMARTLKDSILIADSYNFIGLFYMNLDSSRQAITFYKQGLLYARQPPYPERYLSLSKPYHLYGNMAEAYYKYNQYDSALMAVNLSLNKAAEIQNKRGLAVAYTLKGDILYAIGLTDSAMLQYLKAKQISKKSGDMDVELLTYSGLAKCYTKKGDIKPANLKLDSGSVLINHNPQINRFFTIQFYSGAADIYESTGNLPMLVKALKNKSAVEAINLNSNNAQIQTVLNAGLKNETRLLNMEVLEARQKQDLSNTRFLVVLFAMFLLIVVVVAIWYNTKQKLKLAKVRSTISQDLHDDIGASLSSLQIYGSIADQMFDKDPQKAKEIIKKISMQSKQVMDNMNDIVWSMRGNDSNPTSMVMKIKNYGAELLDDKNINCRYAIDEESEKFIHSIHARRNVLLITKEAMNNLAKYSQASMATISLQASGEQVILRISDNGVGFSEKPGGGNGLVNMQKRTEELGGRFGLNSSPGKGTMIECIFPTKRMNKA